jgi:hypothetical protein
MIRIDRNDLDHAASAGGISTLQAAALWQHLSAHAAAAGAADTPRFSFTHLLYYFGGLLAIGAMSLFMTLGWEQFGGWGVFFIALLYFAVAWKLATWFEAWKMKIPMGLMAALALVLVPLATWGLQNALGFWVDAPGAQNYRQYHQNIDWRWLTLEFATLLAGVLMLYRWRAPFMLMPIAVTLWYMSMDLAMLLMQFGESWWSSSAWTFRSWFSVAFGLITVLLAFWVELRNRSTIDYSFWLYLFGLLTFWCGLTMAGEGKLSGTLVYLAINMLLVFAGALLMRRTFTVFGALGVVVALGNLSWNLFRDSWLFPIALSAIGIAIVFAGVAWSRREAELTQALRAMLPAPIRASLEARS